MHFANPFNYFEPDINLLVAGQLHNWYANLFSFMQVGIEAHRHHRPNLIVFRFHLLIYARNVHGSHFHDILIEIFDL